MKNLIYSLQILAILHIFSSFTFSQSRNSSAENKEWYQGNMILTNGQKINGKLSYNFFTDVISQQLEGYVKHYSPKEVTYFELEDSLTSNSKKYYSLSAASERDRMTKKRFFELIHKTGSIVLLRRNEYYFDQSTSTSTSVAGTMSYGTVTFSRVLELIYLANKKHLLEYATKWKDKDEAIRDNLTFAKNDELVDISKEDKPKKSKKLRYKVTNKDALLTVTKPYHYEIKEYLKSEDLKANTLTEIIQVMNNFAILEK